MLRLNTHYKGNTRKYKKIQIQPMLRLNYWAVSRYCPNEIIQIQPMLRLNAAAVSHFRKTINTFKYNQC